MAQPEDDQRWTLVDSEEVFSSDWLSVEKRSYKLPDGSQADNYYHLKRPDYVLVLAVDKDRRLLVERQYRRGVDDFVYELPAGWIKQGESPQQAAKRELEEETGMAGAVTKTVEIYPQPGFSSMKAYVCVMEVSSSTGSHNREADEYINWSWLEPDKISGMVKNDEIKDMGFLAALELR